MDSLSTPAELARKAVEDLARETGERIRSIRGSRSQIEFAELLGIGRTTLIRYESGERRELSTKNMPLLVDRKYDPDAEPHVYAFSRTADDAIAKAKGKK